MIKKNREYSMHKRVIGAEFSSPEYGRAVKESFVSQNISPIPIPLVRQARNYTCGVACVEAILRYIGYDFDTREDILADLLSASHEKGTAVKEILCFLNQVRYADENGYKISATLIKNWNVAGLRQALSEGNPVICMIQAWHCDEDGQCILHYDYTNEWEDGHYVIAVAFDKQNIYFMDPSVAGNYTYIAVNEFEKRWHDTDERVKYLCTGIVITIRSPQYNKSEYFMTL